VELLERHLPRELRNFLWTLQGLWRAPYGPKDYVSWKLTYGGGFGVYMCSRKNCLETQKLWSENECPSTPAVSGELQSGPRLSTPNSNSNTSLQPPKRTTTSSISKWHGARVLQKLPNWIGSEVHTIFRKQKKILNSSSVLQWQWITIMANSSKKIDKIWGCFKCWVDVPFVPRCSRLSNNNRQAQPTPRNFQPPLMVPENPRP